MINFTRLFLFACALLLGNALLLAQTPMDGVMMKQRESCLAVVYDYGSWDQYWEGENLRTHGIIGTYTRKTITPMLAMGLHDRLNLIVSLPYVKTESKEPNGGFMAGVSGFQDISISLKGQLLEKEIGTGKLLLLANVGFSTPATNYLSDYMPYSLGFGAPELSVRGIGQYKLNNGLYAMLGVAHLWRGMTEIERDYYYADGSYFSNKMDVPNAWNFNAAVGMMLLDNDLRVEATYVSLISTSGDDIRKYNPGQPTNKVEYGQVGLFTHYTPEKLKGLGVLAYGSTVISGRNWAKSTNFGAGITYQFKI